MSPTDQVESEQDSQARSRLTNEHLRVISGDEEPRPDAEPIAWDHDENAKRLRLYHFPTSPGSQQVRLALAEKALVWDSRVVNTGPKLENFEPWFAKLNPKLTVPALRVGGDPHEEGGGEIFVGPFAIIEYLDANFPGAALVPEDPETRAEVERWIELHDQFPLRLLAHARSKGMVRWFQRWSLRHQAKRLRRQIRRNPELREIYEAKLAALEEFQQALRDRPTLTRLVDEVEDLLDDLDDVLDQRKWLAADHYTAADLAWTAVVSKLEHIGFARSLSQRRRPHLHRWVEQLRARPSWGSMIRRLSAMQAIRFYGPAVARSLAIAWAIKWAITGIVIAIGWLLSQM